MTPPTNKRISECVKIVQESIHELCKSDFYAGLTATLAGLTGPAQSTPVLEEIRALVVYGLGSLEQPGAVHIRYQLALACRLAELLQDHVKVRPQAYDPAFRALDLHVLPALGVDVTPINEEGRRVVNEPTLFFMPHCEAELMDNLVAANEAAGSLSNVVILGNSFRQYHERFSMRSGEVHVSRPETLLRLVTDGRVVEVPVPEIGFPVTSAFNDISLHMFT